MRALFDISMLLALFDGKHIHHARAITWWRNNRSAGWATCPLTENGFLRIASQPGYSAPVSLADALALLRGWAKPPHHEFWADDASLLDPDTVDHGRLLGPRMLTDTYLLALAVKHGGRFVTFDRGVSLAAVKGATAEHLVTV